MLRRKFLVSSLTNNNLIKLSPCLISTKYFCSSPSDQQQQQKVPDVLKQFDQLMKTNPKFRQLYPKLLTAIVSKSRSEISTIANAMIEAAEPKESTKVDVANSSTEKVAKENVNAKSTEEASINNNNNNLNLIVVDVAFA